MGIRSKCVSFFIFIVLFLSSSVIAEKLEKASGELSLKITSRTAPAPLASEVQMDVKICGPTKAPPSAQLAHDNGLKNVVVWLESQTRPTANLADEEEASIHIRGCEFVPHIIIVKPEQPVLVRSEDLALFQVRTNPKKNPKQTRALPPNLEAIQFRFKEPEIIPLLDDLHPWMRSYIVVAAHGLYQITNSEGLVKFKNLRPGQYLIYLWHETLGSRQLAEPANINSNIVRLKFDWTE